MTVIGHIHTELSSKFGVPRQSGLVQSLRGRIIFEEGFRSVEALRGLDGYSHIWLLWDFSLAHRDKWSPTVRPPRLGGNRRMGVWATRSPFRPNHIGLSSVRIVSIDLYTPEGPVIEVEGIDMMDGTPIYDIKPYLPFTDCHTDARGGFAGEEYERFHPLDVIFPPDWDAGFTPRQQQALKDILSSDPRPTYHHDPERIYAFPFAGKEIHFRVDGNVLEVVEH